jgi:hypothetical protein
LAAGGLVAGGRSGVFGDYGAELEFEVSLGLDTLDIFLTECSVLGWVPGIITMLVAGVLFYITSLTMHKFIMKHPQIKDICDFGYYAFGESRIAYEFTAIMLLLNNSAYLYILPTRPEPKHPQSC